jgi:multicomponent Na+:H+ antiporter subunit B
MGNNKNGGMSIIVKTTARFTTWFILLYGFNLIIHGHITTGSGFAGGLMIALALIHLILAYGKDYIRQRINPEWIQKIMASGVFFFLLIGCLGLLIAGKFFVNFLAKGHLFGILSGGTIPLINLCIGLNVGILLYIGFYYLVEFRSQGR